MKNELIGVLIAFMASLFAVIYSPENYDIWDCVLAGMSAFICIRYKSEFITDKVIFFIARMSLSVAIVIFIMTIFTILNLKFLKFNSEIFCRIFSIVDSEFIYAISIFCLSFLFYKRSVSK